MAQVVRPVADVSVNGWTPVPVYSRINESPPDDSSLVSPQDSPQGDNFEVDFPVLARPEAGAHRLTVRMRRTVDLIAVLVTLRMAGKAVASRTFYPSTTFADYTIDLQPAEIAAITDYRLLTMSVLAGPTKDCDQCPAAALQWQFQLSGITSSTCFNCSVLNRNNVLTYTGKTPGGSPECFNLCTWEGGEQLDPCNDGVGFRWFLTYANFASIGASRWHLSLIQGCNIVLNPDTPVVVDYVFEGPGAFDCLGPNDFTGRTITNTICGNFPLTITLSPV